MKWLDAITRRFRRPAPPPNPWLRVESCTVSNSYRLHTFVDQYVDLTDKHVEHCTFDGCVVELRRGQARVVYNTFRLCDLVGDGWPPGMVEETKRLQG